MNVICKADVDFLQVNVFGESAHLNPFNINISHIRYIREYSNSNNDKNEWAIMVGDKMYPTRDLNFDNIKIGDVVNIGSTKFECVLTTSLTEKKEIKTLVNHKNTLYIRKFIKKDNKLDYKKDIKIDGKISENTDKFAIITIDDRIVPFFNENVKKND